MARVPVSSHLSCVCGSGFPRAFASSLICFAGFFPGICCSGMSFQLTDPDAKIPKFKTGVATAGMTYFFELLAFLFCCLSVLPRLIRSDGGSRLWRVCLRVNTDYRRWVSDLRSPPVSGSGFVFSPSLWLGLASPQWSPCRPPLFPAAPFRRLGSLFPLPFPIEPN